MEIKRFLKIKKYDHTNYSAKDNSSIKRAHHKESNGAVQIDEIMDNLALLSETYRAETQHKGWKAQIKNFVIKWLYRYNQQQMVFNKELAQTLKLIHSEHAHERKKVEESLIKLQNKINRFEHTDDLRGVKEQEFSDNIVELRSQINSLYELKDISDSAQTERTSYRSFSQFGEDQWILNNLKLPKKGLFIDVGAADGITYSNTYALEKSGWDGYCFEPDPYNYEKAKVVRKHVEMVAISEVDGKVEFSISGISPDLSGIRINSELSTIEVDSMRLDSFLDKQNVKKIDLISIDTEGTELDVWRSLSYPRFKPTVVIIEYVANGVQNNEILEYFTKLDYKLVLTTKSNYIFELVDKPNE